jgi:hypothetical protein
MLVEQAFHRARCAPLGRPGCGPANRSLAGGLDVNLVRILLLALVLAACGSDDTNTNGGDVTGDDGDGDIANAGDCARRSCNVPELHTCYQWQGDDANNAAFCEQLGGTPSDGPCPKENAVGGCKTSSPFGGSGCAVNWGYAPVIDAQDVRDDCAERGVSSCADPCLGSRRTPAASRPPRSARSR